MTSKMLAILLIVMTIAITSTHSKPMLDDSGVTALSNNKQYTTGKVKSKRMLTSSCCRFDPHCCGLLIRRQLMMIEYLNTLSKRTTLFRKDPTE